MIIKARGRQVAEGWIIGSLLLLLFTVYIASCREAFTKRDLRLGWSHSYSTTVGSLQQLLPSTLYDIFSDSPMAVLAPDSSTVLGLVSYKLLSDIP